MVQSDYDLLIEMGFDPERSRLAVDKTKGLQDAIEWLDKNSSKPLEELTSIMPAQALGGAASASAGDLDADGDRVEASGTAASLKCTDCGKLFSSPERAQFHATRTDHQNFEESTEVIVPLTEEEKKAKLEELREKLAAKRAAQATVDLAETKRNEAIRRKKTQETEQLKEELRRKEQLKAVEANKREKLEDAKAKERVKQKIREQQEAKRAAAEREKAQREGRPLPGAAAPAAPVEQQKKVTVNHSESRLQLRLPTGQQPLIKTFRADATLFEVAVAVQEERGISTNSLVSGDYVGRDTLADVMGGDIGFEPTSFTMTFPRKVFQQGIDFGMTLKEAGMVPSCALIVN